MARAALSATDRIGMDVIMNRPGIESIKGQQYIRLAVACVVVIVANPSTSDIACLLLSFVVMKSTNQSPVSECLALHKRTQL
jgi:hypothetical protein